ncbi:unnamed protein product, partial [Ectocarpus sp. 12 AP-2014]
MVPSRPFPTQHNFSRKRVMSRRRRPRSPQRVVSRRIVNAAAASVLLCAGSTTSRVDAFCSTSPPSSAAAGRFPTASSSSTATTQKQPHRLRLDGASATASPLWSSRLESNARISSSSSCWRATAPPGIGASAFVPRRSQRRTATAAAATLAGRQGRKSAVGALGMAADVLTTLGKDALMFLAATVAVVPACKKLNISPVLGFLATGAILGPSGISVIKNLNE